MATILITGANKGLGFESARQLLAAGHTVYLGSRDAERGRRAAEQLGARFLQLDVTDDASVEAAAKAVDADGGLDVLINNAGVAPEYGDDGTIVGAPELTPEIMQWTVEVNVVGVVRVLRAFLPVLARSAAPVVVNVSSGLASVSAAADGQARQSSYPGVAYPASKAALNMLTIRYAAAFPDVRINSVGPGFTSTDLNAFAGAKTVEQGATIIVAMAQIGRDGPTGTYVEEDGPMPW